MQHLRAQSAEYRVQSTEYRVQSTTAVQNANMSATKCSSLTISFTRT